MNIQSLLVSVGSSAPGENSFLSLFFLLIFMFNMIISIILYVLITSACRKIKDLNNDSSSSVVEALLCLFVPFYGIYWCYTRTLTMASCANKRQVYLKNNANLYLVLCLLGLSIVSVLLIHNDLNLIEKQLSNAAFSQLPFNSQQQIRPFQLNCSYQQELQQPVIYSSKQEKQPSNIDFEKLIELAKLRDNGIITVDEFENKKAVIISRL